jgi:hypothetical protein
MSSRWRKIAAWDEFRWSWFLPGLERNVFCAWCGEHMPELSYPDHEKRRHAAIAQANREWERSNPL